jgi:hypothetical protein
MNLKDLFKISWRKMVFTLGFFIIFFLISIQYRYFSWINYDEILVWDKRPGVISTGMSENAVGVVIIRFLITILFSYLLAVITSYLVSYFKTVKK